MLVLTRLAEGKVTVPNSVGTGIVRIGNLVLTAFGDPVVAVARSWVVEVTIPIR